MNMENKNGFASFMQNFYLKLWTTTLVTQCMSNALVSSCYLDYNVAPETILNKTSVGRTIVSSKIVGPQMCVRECLERNCHSVYYKKDTLECELNSKDHLSLQVGGAIQEHSNFSFINISLAKNLELQGFVSQFSVTGNSQQNYVCVTLKSKKTACVGDFRPRDCEDIRAHGSESDGVYTLYPTTDVVIQAYCDMTTDAGGWTVFQRRMNGEMNFYRPWEDYRDGFGNLAGEYWLGNTYLHQLTSNRSCQLRIDFLNWENVTGYAIYKEFSIGNDSDGFMLKIGSYSGSAGDNLAFHNEAKFSTYDRDNDQRSDIECAEFHTGAWWFSVCISSHLNGDYSKRDHRGIVWGDYPSSIHMKKTTMQLKCD